MKKIPINARGIRSTSKEDDNKFWEFCLQQKGNAVLIYDWYNIMLRLLAEKEARDGLSVKVEFKSIHIAPSKSSKFVSDILNEAWEGIPHERNQEISFRSSHDRIFTIIDADQNERMKPYIGNVQF